MITQLRTIKVGNKSEYVYSVGFSAVDFGGFIVTQPPTYANMLQPEASYKYNGQIIQPLNVANVPPYRSLRGRVDFGQLNNGIVPGTSYQFPKFVVFTSDGGMVEIASDESDLINTGAPNYVCAGDVVNFSVPIFNDSLSNINVGYVTNGVFNTAGDYTAKNPESNRASMLLQFLTYTERPFWNRVNNRAQYATV
jgi:hypothetical protein